MMPESNDDPQTLEPPKYDTLYVSFKGDKYPVVLPYCEVANGNITLVRKNIIEITTSVGGVKDMVSLSFDEFTEAIEASFDTKKITKLEIQLAKSYELHKIV